MSYLDTLSQFAAFPWPPSAFIYGPGPVTTTANPGLGTMRLSPQYVPDTVRLIGIITETTVAGEAGSAARVGVYASASNGMPTGAPLATAVNATDNVAFTTGTVNVVLQPGYYWFAACLEGAPITQPTIRNVGTTAVSFAGASTVSSNAGLSVPGVTAGSLPTLTSTMLAIASNVYHMIYQTGVL